MLICLMFLFCFHCSTICSSFSFSQWHCSPLLLRIAVVLSNTPCFHFLTATLLSSPALWFQHECCTKLPLQRPLATSSKTSPKVCSEFLALLSSLSCFLFFWVSASLSRPSSYFFAHSLLSLTFFPSLKVALSPELILGSLFSYSFVLAEKSHISQASKLLCDAAPSQACFLSSAPQTRG